MKPLLFLDVDGVLNVLNFEIDADRLEDDSAMLALVPKGTKERMYKLQESFDIIWATAWMGRANSFFRAHLDLRDTPWPHLTYFGLKLPEILKMAGNTPWVWIDDDAEWELRQVHSAFRSLPNSLILKPDTKTGLDDGHVQQALDFAATYLVKE